MALADDIDSARSAFRLEAVRMAKTLRRLSRLTAAGASADALRASWDEMRADMVTKATPALQQALRLEHASARA
jgi:hypothetical protein